MKIKIFSVALLAFQHHFSGVLVPKQVLTDIIHLVAELKDLYEEVTYALDTIVLKDFVGNFGSSPVTGLDSDYIDAPEEGIIAANATATFTVSLDFTDDIIQETCLLKVS